MKKLLYICKQIGTVVRSSHPVPPPARLIWFGLAVDFLKVVKYLFFYGKSLRDEKSLYICNVVLKGSVFQAKDGNECSPADYRENRSSRSLGLFS